MPEISYLTPSLEPEIVAVILAEILRAGMVNLVAMGVAELACR